MNTQNNTTAQATPAVATSNNQQGTTATISTTKNALCKLIDAKAAVMQIVDTHQESTKIVAECITSIAWKVYEQLEQAAEKIFLITEEEERLLNGWATAERHDPDDPDDTETDSTTERGAFMGGTYPDTDTEKTAETEGNGGRPTTEQDTDTSTDQHHRQN